MLQRAPRPEPAQENIQAPQQVLLDVVWAVQHDPTLNRRPKNYQVFRDRYREEMKLDLDDYYAHAPVSVNQDEIKDTFVRKKTMNQIGSTLAETLPLYANKAGRLGDNIEAEVTKTAKQDDQGNSFIDFVIEVRNKWLANGAPKEFQDLPERMTFLIDTVVQEGESLFDAKDAAFRRQHLDTGALANVKCYENRLGGLGISKPKVIAYQDGNQLKETGLKLGPCIVKHAADKFTINAPEKFDKVYREYFLSLMEAIAENAKSNSIYLQSLPPDAKSKERANLSAEYAKIVNFIEAYKKTPTTKERAS